MLINPGIVLCTITEKDRLNAANSLHPTGQAHCFINWHYESNSG